MDLSALFNRNPHISEIVSSLILIIGLLLVRTVLTRMVRRRFEGSDLRRRWLVNLRNGVALATVLGLGLIWVNELRTLALSIAAFAVAMVIALKELILCVSGSVLRTTTNAFSVGDRIEVGQLRGDVIDHNLLTTTILEVGPGRSFHLRTGRTLAIPNSLFLTTPVVNESYMKQYVVHTFAVPVKVDADWRRAEQVLLAAASDECASFLEEAAGFMRRLEREHGLDGLAVRPRVYVNVPDADKVSLVVRFPAPVGRQGRLEQSILRRFLAEFGGPATPGARERDVAAEVQAPPKQ